MILLKRGLFAAAMALAAIAALTQPGRAESLNHKAAGRGENGGNAENHHLQTGVATFGTGTETCNREAYENTNYIICAASADGTGLHLFWKNMDGEPYRNFSKVADAAASRGQKLVFAFNAGMYQPDFSPMGLYVEDGRELRPPSRTTPAQRSGPLPNFYKKPNGIFYLGDKGAEILPTDRFLKQRIKPQLATQSGPMLVIRNRINPIFIVGSTDKTRRSGVGICDGGAIRFAVSQDAVNFHDFAKLFRNHLQCANALFLDGGGGAGIYVPALQRNDISWHGGYGPMFGFIE